MTTQEGDTEVKAAGQSADLTGFNLAAAAFFIMAAIFALFYLIPVHVPLRSGLDQGLTAQFMPRVAAWSMLILAGLLFLEVTVRRQRGMTPLEEDNEDNEQQGFGPRERSNVLILVAGSATYIALLYVFGFLISTVIMLFACFWAGKMRNLVWLALLCIAFPYALQRALWHGLYVIMPAGQF